MTPAARGLRPADPLTSPSAATRVVKAVDGVSFTLHEGETLGLVGESGMRQDDDLPLDRRAAAAGRRASSAAAIVFEGRGPDHARASARCAASAAARIAMILQDPMASLNPLFTIYRQVAEPAYLPPGLRGRTLRERVQELLRAVRIPSPAMRMREYPHQMSGGMRQRIVGAIALAGGPKLIIADEPTTNLDVTIQAQYLDLLKDLQRETGVALIFVTHNLGHRRQDVRQAGGDVCRQDRRAGAGARAVQRAQAPLHARRCSARCRSSAARSRCIAIPGQPPNLATLPPGCAFHPRCPDALPRCATRGAAGDFDLRSTAWRRPVLARRTATAEARRPWPQPLLEVRGLTKHFPVGTALFCGARSRWVKAVDGIDFAIDAGRDARAHRRIRLRQDHHLQADPAAGDAHRRARSASRAEDIAGLEGKDADGATAARCRWCSRTRTARSARACGSATSSPSRWRSTPTSRARRSRERVAEVLELVGLQPGRGRRCSRTSSAAGSASASPSPGRWRPTPGSSCSTSRSRRSTCRSGPRSSTSSSTCSRPLGVSYLFIGHDLATVAHISHRIAVMYLGKIVETGGQRRALRPTRCTRTPRRCSPPRCRPIPTTRSTNGCHRRARSRAPSRRRPAAASTRAARRRCRAAPRWSRR